MTEIYEELDKNDACPERAYYGLFINNSKFDRLEEHSLWTYWQGRGVRNPKIMVVGQDWGYIEQSEKYYEYIKKHPDAKVVSYEQIREENPQPIALDLGEGHHAKMFVISHLGSLGKANRKRYFNKKGIEKTVEDDWKVVEDYIKRKANDHGKI